MNSSSSTDTNKPCARWTSPGPVVVVVTLSVMAAVTIADGGPSTFIGTFVILVIGCVLVFFVGRPVDVRAVPAGVAISTWFGLRRRILRWNDILHIVEVPEMSQGSDQHPREYFMTTRIVPKDLASDQTRIRFKDARERDHFLAELEEQGVTVLRDDRDPEEAYLGLTTIDLN